MQIILKLSETEAKSNCEQTFRSNLLDAAKETSITVDIQRDDIPNYEWASKHKAFMAKFVMDTMGKLNIQRPLLSVLHDAVWEQLDFDK